MICGKFLQYRGRGTKAGSVSCSTMWLKEKNKKVSSLQPTWGERKEQASGLALGPLGPGREEDALVAPPSVDAASTSERPLTRWLQTRVHACQSHTAFARGQPSILPRADALSAVERGLGPLSLWAWRLDALARSQAGLCTEKGAVGPGHFLVQVCSASFIPRSGSV